MENNQTNIGTVTTTDAAGNVQNINIADVSKNITSIGRSQFPLDSILRELPSVTSEGFEYKHYSTRERGIRDTVKTPYEVTQGSEAGVKELIVNNAQIWSLDGLIMVPSVQVNADGSCTVLSDGAVSINPLILNIVEINRGSGKLTIQAINATTIPALAVDTILTRLGVAKHELAAFSEDPSQMPFDDFNYCQIHMTTVSEGLYQKLQKKDVNWGIIDMQEQAIMDFRLTNEATSLFGTRSKFKDLVSNKLKYTSDGLLRKIGKHLDMGAKTAIDNDLLYGWCGDIFRGNNGSERRICFYGKEFGRELAKSTTVQKQLEADKTEVVFGISFKKIETTDGTLLLKPHDLFDEYGYGKMGMVVDPGYLFRAIQKPLETTELDRDRSGQSRSKDVRIDESHALITTNAEVHATILVK